MKKVREICLALARLLSIWFTLLALVLATANYAASIYLRTPASTERYRRPRTLKHYGLSYFQRVYPGKSEAEIIELIRDQAQVGAVYEPYAEFRPSPFISPTLNIHTEGFRLIGSEHGPWPPDKNAINIFVFGGSITLGSGVTDAETIPAVMQSRLRSKTGLANVTFTISVPDHFSRRRKSFICKISFVPRSSLNCCLHRWAERLLLLER